MMSPHLLDKRWPWLLAAAVIVLAFLSSVVEIRLDDSDASRPLGSAEDIAALRERDDLNVLFVLIDTLRSDRLGSYGYERDTSPAMDRLAASGARFARHLSQSSWTKCSMASLWTGMYPTRTGITRYNDVLPEEAQMPAEILKQAGFRTQGIFRNGWVASTFGFEQGFDSYVRPVGRPMPPSIRLENPTINGRGTDEDLVTTALEFLRVHGDERWFLYLHLMDIHEYLYDEESALFGGSYSDIYDNSIRWTDHVIEVLLAHLAAEGYAENTLVIVSADHGEAFLERGLEGHARKVFRETTEVPFLIHFPFRLEPGVVVNARSRNVDVWPTILDLLGLEFEAEVDGRSLVPALLASARGEAPAREEGSAVAHLDQHWGQEHLEPQPTVAVVDGPLRYVRSHVRGQELEQLFDAGEDPDELTNLAAQDPEAVERLRAVADAYLEQSPPWGESPTREIGEMELNQLRALGYAVP